MPHPGRTAVVLLVPELDPVLDAVRARWPGTVRPGIPAHVTVLYPFVPAAQLTDAVVDRCRALCAGTGPRAMSFTRAEVWPEIVAAAPDPVAPVAGLTRAFAAAWPDHPPYGGRFGPEPVPHVTLAVRSGSEPAAEIAATVDALLPLRAEPDTAVLVEITDGGWAQRAVLPL